MERKKEHKRDTYLNAHVSRYVSVSEIDIVVEMIRLC